tara:strand:- start:355 stop:807 length:453 start_codon:yes stop_codon:yes gene_type:complete
MAIFKSKKTYTSSKGLSCCFRQFKAESHCKYLHGYSLGIAVEFKATELDDKNWVVDFGSLKNLEKEFKHYFDHKTLVDKDDPHLEWFETGQDLGLLDLVILDDGVGCEMFAYKIYKISKKWLEDSKFQGRCEITKIEVKEHDSNSVIYLP